MSEYSTGQTALPPEEEHFDTGFGQDGRLPRQGGGGGAGTARAAAARPSALEAFIDAMIDLGQTGQIFGEHGIGKTATFAAHIARAYDDTELVYVPAANLAPDDLLVNAPVRDPRSGELVLRQLVMRQLKPGRNFVLLIDDSLQAGPAIQSQLMQIACNWTLGEHDLRALGCIGVFLADNESLAETAARRSDFAILDRMVTIKVTANDTAWREALRRAFPQFDLTAVFRLWAAQPPEIRRLLSPRTLEHILANAAEGFPLVWGLPLLNGTRLRLALPAAEGTRAKEVDRTGEILDAIAAALNVPNRSAIADPVRRLVRAALKNRWCVLVQGPPGCGKTEVVRALIQEVLRRDPLYFSLPVTNVEDLCAPVPSPDGTLDNLLAAGFTGDEPKAVVWDEYNRPKDKAAFARLMEITQEWSVAGRPIRGLRAQVALQNPPYHVGRKLLVARNNIAQASRFTASLDITPEDIPANEWLIAKYGPVAETVLEWWKNDIDDEGRAWITKRTLERLIRLHGRGLPLQQGLVYLGDGEYAPVPLGGLTARLAGSQRTGLKELAADVDTWERRLALAVSGDAEGDDASDVVHQVFANAELSQLKKQRDVVIRLATHLPPKLRATYLVGASEDAQSFWVGVLAACRARQGSARIL
ncbi:AAA ATPase [Catenulispora acidiphila DSM 44928]|uniref:AAA ATPase n=1 Tax=Catenulispora acidiphila (strain DSM 44928 / JCM 14897 / NBRC 102108 / NRRL B-24433 / ID139908) TaxID=479433 RepID=C7QBA5_CATAD|nr:ATPase AAA [Catenulispora acidiphila]ACU76396.1 AAA ATPase [Catenulispora acidiphila DSM 44928]